MAPRKRKAEVEGEAGNSSTDALLRRSSRLAKSAPALKTVFPKKKGTAAEKRVQKTVAKEETEEEEAQTEEKEEGKEETKTDGDKSKKKTIVVEHCKQCMSFKTRAMQVKNGLEKAVPGVTVILNPEKPRKGCFEIRKRGGEKFISLLQMKRPFQRMKALDMDQVISDIIDKII
ncbi:hypothetical protein K2173_003560 [Erythroxylum novogranatense]|uniref:Selenoprotein H n=1 Tax=Erythroxylum novogranatense TaxID=1862640 RepID=A0AAV8TC53_9ROSI|nr:hypothetical protein K2173_003560 [Erythroxylum novogranatense]